MKKLIYISVAALLLFSALWLLRRPIYQFVVTKHLDSKMPAFELLSSDGSAIRSSELQGKILVLDFWTTWCGVCKKSFPEFEKTIAEFQGNPQLVFLTVNTGAGGDSLEKALEFVKKHNYPFPVAFDQNSALSQKLNITNYPTIVIVDSGGKMRFRHIGYAPAFENYAALIGEKIEALLAGRGDS